MYESDFDGVFKFTNVTDEDFIALWNSKEYMFPAGMCCPLIIPDETLESIQEIRKRFAYKLAVREFYKGKEYNRMKKLGGGLPPTFDEKILEPMIETCLKPLPMAKARVRVGKKTDDRSFKASRAISEKDNPNFVFKDDPVQEKGLMPETPID